MSDTPDPGEQKGQLSERDILQLTEKIDFGAIKRRVRESEEFLERHRVPQEKLDIEISR